MEGRYITRLANVRHAGKPSGIWIEDEIRCDKLTRYVPGAGRTGKAVIYFVARVGGCRVLDEEDIITIARTPQRSR